MLHFITWSEFLIAIAAILLVYWLTVGLFYYKKEISGLIRQDFQKADTVIPNQDAQNQGDLFDECSLCASNLKLFLRQSSIRKMDKQQLLNGLNGLLRPYHHYCGTIWQIPINNLIEYRCKQDFSLALTEMELAGVWKD